MSKKYYESYVIIDGNLDDNAVQDVVTKFTNFFKRMKLIFLM